jgi:hypothetical protein
MITRCLRDPLIGSTIIKVAICTPREAAQIVESTATPNERLVKCLTRAGTRLREIDPAKDPDRAAFLMWLGEAGDDDVTMILKIARLVDEFGEKRRDILLPHGQVWPKEIEAHYKGQIFMRVTEALGIPSIKFNKMKGEFMFDLTKEKVEIEITDRCGKEGRNGMRCYGRCNKTHKEGEKAYLIELSSERLDMGLWLVWILFHETIHVKQGILRNLMMEIPEDLEGADPFLVSPKMDATIMGRLFEDALRSLL